LLPATTAPATPAAFALLHYLAAVKTMVERYKSIFSNNKGIIGQLACPCK
jgi:hypothetical protein